MNVPAARTYEEHVRVEGIRKRPYQADETPYPPPSARPVVEEGEMRQAT
jgi:hypothetical protein